MPTFLPLADAPVVEGGKGGDAGAEQRRGAGEREVGGDAENEVLIDDDGVGVAAVGDAAEVLVREVVGEDACCCRTARSPALHSGQVRSESTMQPTAARSPTLNLVTAEPTLVTRPTISWPGTQG